MWSSFVSVCTYMVLPVQEGDRHGHGRRLGLGGPLSPQASSRSNNTKTRAELAKGRFCSFFLTSSGDESAQSSDLQIC